jgi:hypothetical protein
MPKDDQARMASGGMLKDMAEAAVPRQDDPTLPLAGFHYLLIGEALQAFFGNRADFVTCSHKKWNVLRA